MNFDFSRFNHIGAQVKIQSQYNDYLYNQATIGVAKDYGSVSRKEQTQRVTESVRQIRAHHFSMLTTKSISHGSKDLGISGAELLRVEHPQLASALAIQQTLIMVGYESTRATILALSAIGCSRPSLVQEYLLEDKDVLNEENRSAQAI